MSTMKRATILGLPTPKSGSAPAPTRRNTPVGRYRVIAPDAPPGSILRVTQRDSSTRLVELVCSSSTRLFVDVDGADVDFCEWDFATRAEAESFRFERRITRYSDIVEFHGAPAFASCIRGLPEPEREAILAAVMDQLRVRGKDGKATQVAVYR